jgi:hypothetical protein
MATDVECDPEISVLVSDPDGDPLDVAFYDASGPTLIDTVYSVASGSRVSIVWSDLEYGTTYQWFTIAFDGEEETFSDTWEFETIENPNTPPYTPCDPSGPNPVYAEYTWEYNSMTTDPDDDHIFYRWSWGDELTDWMGPYDSGEQILQDHIWTTQGDYAIQVQAKDDPNGDGDPEDGLESPWSDEVFIHVKYPGDITDDGMVNSQDLIELLNQWGSRSGSADINGDGVVNVSDLFIVLGNWT